MKYFSLLFLFIILYPIYLCSDPILVWSTFLGGSDIDMPTGFKIDSLGNVFIFGGTDMPNFPTTPGVYNDTLLGPTSFLTELDSLGSSLIFSTFIGSAWSNDIGNCLQIDKFGNYYLTGYARSTYPTTPGVFNPNYGCGNDPSRDVYVTKLNSKGSALIYSTFICSGYGMAIDIDSSLNSYITGFTEASLFPTTIGAYCTKFNNDPNLYHRPDIFISKLNPKADSLIFSTYIGGTSDDRAYDIKIDDIGNAYITGRSQSLDYPTTSNAYFKTCTDGDNMIITKLSPDGDSLVYSTYFGGNLVCSCNEMGTSIAIDSDGNIYITGTEFGPDFPVTPGAYNTKKNAKNKYSSDIIITKFNSTCNSLIFSTFLGGSLWNYSGWLKLDNYNNVYIIGTTWADNYPVTDSSIYKNFTYSGDNNSTVIISELNYNGNSLIYSTYLSGGLCDYGDELVIDKKYIYACGETASNQFPITPAAYDTSINGNFDIFITKLGPIIGRPSIHSINNINFPDLVCGDIDTTITIINSGNDTLNLTKIGFSGKDSIEFKIIQPSKFPVLLPPDDTLKMVIRYISTKIRGIKNDTLYLENNTSINPFKINISLINSIDYTIDNSVSDTIIVDFGKFCPKSSSIDTTITLFNKSSKGTTFYIENNDPQIQVSPAGKAEKKEGDTPLAIPKKKKKK